MQKGSCILFRTVPFPGARIASKLIAPSALQNGKAFWSSGLTAMSLNEMELKILFAYDDMRVTI